MEKMGAHDEYSDCAVMQIMLHSSKVSFLALLQPSNFTASKLFSCIRCGYSSKCAMVLDSHTCKPKRPSFNCLDAPAVSSVAKD